MYSRLWIGLALLVMVIVAGAAHAQTEGACFGFSTELVVGGQGRVLPGTPNKVRDQPGTDAARIGTIPGDAVFNVIEGPVCADEYTWWQVEYQGTTGWTVEGQASEHFVTGVTSGTDSDSFSITGADGATRTVSANLIHSIGYYGSRNNDLPGDSIPPENICVRQAAPGEAYRPILSIGIRAYSLPDYSTNTLHVLSNSRSSPEVIGLQPGAVIPDVGLIWYGSYPPFGYTPAICVGGSATSATATSPSGDVVEPYIQALDGVTQVQLPPRAYIEPGDWRLRVDDYEITVQIATPSIPAPFSWRFHGRGDQQQGFYILGGYQPGEQVIVINEQGELVQVQIDSHGFAVIQFTHSAVIIASVPQNGENMSLPIERIFVREGGDFSATEGFYIPDVVSRTILYNVVWLEEPFDGTTWTCPDTPPVYMRMDIRRVPVHPYRLTIESLYVRNIPSLSGNVITSLSRDDVVEAVNGVFCADNMVWWYVNVRKPGSTEIIQHGYVAEGTADQHFFEPAT